MSARHFLAVDLGAESGRVMRGRLSGGRLALEEVHRFANGMLRIGEHCHWNVFRLYEEIVAGLGQSASAGERPAGIGVDTWGVDFALLARDGSILGLPYAYRDGQTAGMPELLFQRLPRNVVYACTGTQILAINTIYQLLALAERRSPLLEAAADLLFIPDLFNYLLAGEKRSEFTFATTSQLYNPWARAWEPSLFDAIGVAPAIMQQVCEPGTVVGKLVPALQAETGLGPAPIIAPATHDTASAVAAVPAAGDDWAYISSGTWSLMGIETAQPIAGPQALAHNFTNEGRVAGTFRFLKNIMGLWLLQRCRQAWEHDGPLSYDDLTRLAAEAPAFGPLIDPDRPEFLNPPDMPAAIRAFCRRAGEPVPQTRGEVVRCIFESLALRYRMVLDELHSVSGRPIRRIHVVGGGSRNALLCGLVADATGVPVIAGPVEATAMGNVLVQALAVGELGSLSDMREVVRRSAAPRVYEPAASDAWDAAYARFRAICAPS